MGRREVVKVQLDKAGVLRENVGQIGAGGKEGYLLVDARGPGVGEVKGLFADTKGVSGERFVPAFQRIEVVRVGIEAEGIRLVVPL
jgi:hypothetical protein